MPARLIMVLDVVARRPLAPDIVEFTFRHPTRTLLPPWEPGAHVDLRLPHGRVRQYSLCGSPQEPSTYRIAVKQVMDGRGGSRWLHDNLHPGMQAHVSAPRHTFRLREPIGVPLFVAAGIGITPIGAMALYLASRGMDFQLHYCVRREAEAAYLPELRAACGARLHLHVSASGGRVADWRSVLAPAPPDTTVYCCGPAPLVEELQLAAHQLGRPPEALRAEHFVPTLSDDRAAAPFEARIRSSGKRVQVAADESLLAALAREGLVLPSACLIGVCGTCECGWVAGEVHHRDSVLEPEQRHHVLLPCVSRGAGTVVLDL